MSTSRVPGAVARARAAPGIVRRVDETGLAITDNRAANRYEARLGDRLAGFVDYRLGRARRLLVHTEVPPELGGRGIAAALARFALDDARASGVRVVVLCPYIAAWLARHPEYADVVASRRG